MFLARVLFTPDVQTSDRLGAAQLTQSNSCLLHHNIHLRQLKQGHWRGMGKGRRGEGEERRGKVKGEGKGEGKEGER